MTPVHLRPRAKADVLETERWYDDQRAGLGRDFRVALELTLHSIEESPRLYPAVYRGVRRALLRRFPYSVFYLIEPERVLVLRVLDQARDPRHWRPD